MSGRKSFNHKTFTCYQFQNKLSGIIVDIPEGTYQLKNGIDTNYNEEGLLDLIEKNCPYTIELSDSSVAYLRELVDEKKQYNLGFFSFNKVEKNTVIFDKEVDFKVRKTLDGNIPIYLDIVYENVTVKDDLDGDENYGRVYNDLDIPFTNNINRIKCEYYDEAGYRNSLKYTIYYSNGGTEEIIKPFINAKNKKLIIGSNSVINYTTGYLVEDDIMKFVSYDESQLTVKDLLTDISDKYDVVFKYDNINMIIYVYNKKDYGVVKPLELSLDSNCLEITTSELDDNLLTTSIMVVGQTIDGEDITIRDNNIFGGDIIYCYDYYIKNGLLSESTIIEWNNYINRLNELQEEWDKITKESKEVDKLLIGIEADIMALNRRISYQSDLLSSYITSKEPNIEAQKRASKDLQDYRKQLSDLLKKQSELKEKKTNIKNIIESWNGNNSRKSIKDKNGNNIFSKSSLRELDDIENTVEYRDDYFTDSQALYNYYNNKIKDIVYPKTEFTITGANTKKYLKLCDNIFELGMKHNLDEELKDLFEIDEVRLISMRYDIRNKTYKDFTFSNSYEQSELFEKLISLKRSSVKTSNKISDYKDISASATYSKTMLNSFKTNGIDTNETPIKSNGENTNIEFNKSGFWISDVEDPSKQTAIMKSTIAYTNDSWQTSQVAVDSNGILAEAITGKLLLSDKLSIGDNINGTFFIGEGSKISEDYKNKVGIFILNERDKSVRSFIGIEILSDNETIPRFEMYSSNGKYALSDLGLLHCDSKNGFGYVDSTHPTCGYFYVNDDINYIDVCSLMFRVGALRSTVKTIKDKNTIEGETTHIVNGETTTIEGERLSMLELYDGDTSTLGDVITAPYKVLNEEGISSGYIIDMPLKSLNETPSDIPNKIYMNDKTKDHKHSFKIDITQEKELEYGIFEDSVIATNINVYVNGNLVADNLNGTNELNIKNYLIVGGWNEIKFTSETNGSIEWDMYLKAFHLF